MEYVLVFIGLSVGIALFMGAYELNRIADALWKSANASPEDK